MLPLDTLSSEVVETDFLVPDGRALSHTEAWSMGGIHHQDPSAGLMYQLWTATLAGEVIEVSSSGTREGPYVVPLMGPPGDVRSMSLSFDQNMNLAVAYNIGNISYLYWYNTSINAYTTAGFPSSRSPRITLDDKRTATGEWSDMVLFTIHDDKLCWRYQRERFENLHTGPTVKQGQRIIRAGMTKGLRVRIDLI